MQAGDHVRITWASGRAFLEVYDPDGASSYTVLIADDVDILATAEVGDLVSVELDFADTDKRFRHAARVAERVEKQQLELRLEFLADDREVRDLVLCHARGEAIPYLNRRAERRPVWIRIDVVVDRQVRSAIITEMSELGAFVVIVDPPAPGTRVVARIPSDVGERLELQSRIVYIRRTELTVGCGIEFVFADHREEVRVRRILRAALYEKNS